MAHDVIHILGVRIDALGFSEALDVLERFARENVPRFVVTLNTEIVVRAQKQEPFRDVINSSALTLADAAGVIWASYALGTPLPERMPGVDLVSRLAERTAASGLSMFFLGAAPGLAQRAAEVLAGQNPGLKVVGTYAGSPSVDEEESIIRRIREAAPRFLLVAYGVPAQEFWIHRNLTRLNVPVVINVGGTFDFLAGVARRAPAWMRDLGLEWLFRLVRQPSRWKRMLALPEFVLRVLAARIRMALSGGH